MNDIMTRNLIAYWLIRRRIMSKNIDEEKTETHLNHNALVRVTPDGEPLYYCIGCHNAGKLMNIIESMVRDAMNKGNDTIIRRTGGVKVFHLEWLRKSKCNCGKVGCNERTSCRLVNQFLRNLYRV